MREPALQRGGVVEQRRRAGDLQQPSDHLVVLARDVRPEALAQLRVDEPQVALGHAEVGLVERHLERREQAAEERPARAPSRAAARAVPRRAPRPRRTRTAAAAGSGSRRTPTGWRAAPRSRPPRAWTAASRCSATSARSIGVACSKKRGKSRVVVDERAVALARARRQPLHLGAPCLRHRRVLARRGEQHRRQRLLERAHRQLRVAVAGETTSPCSVIRIRPPSEPARLGEDRAVRAPAAARRRAAAAVEELELQPRLRGLRGQPLLRQCAAPTGSRRSRSPCRGRSSRA